MARSRAPATELAKRLNSSDRPLYVVDARYTIVFVNAAARQWLGEVADRLPGTCCVYNSQPLEERPAAAAAGLCPPPEAMAGATLDARVAVPMPDGRVLGSSVRFIPLGTAPDDILGVVAVARPEKEDSLVPGLPVPEMGDEPGPLQLHGMIQQFRREAAIRYGAECLVGQSPAMRLARRQVELAAACRESVLLLGPPGSGREHTATAIHYRGEGDQSGRLIPLACAVLPAELIYSTIQALASGEAARGTLVLTGADLLPLEVQGAVARTLGKHSFPLRLMASAEQPLADLARRGKYEPELASLLSTITIELPPLAERRCDLPLLAQLFVERYQVQGERQRGGLTPEALDLISSCRWPGNLDELATAIREAHRRATGPLITAGDLPQSVRLAQRAAGMPVNRKEEAIVLDEFLARIERELIRRAVGQAKGNKAKAARLLGLTRPKLYRRMTQLELE